MGEIARVRLVVQAVRLVGGMGMLGTGMDMVSLVGMGRVRSIECGGRALELWYGIDAYITMFSECAEYERFFLFSRCACSISCFRGSCVMVLKDIKGSSNTRNSL